MNYYILTIWWQCFAPMMYRCGTSWCPIAGETHSDPSYFCNPVEVEE